MAALGGFGLGLAGCAGARTAGLGPWAQPAATVAAEARPGVALRRDPPLPGEPAGEWPGLEDDHAQ